MAKGAEAGLSGRVGRDSDALRSNQLLLVKTCPPGLRPAPGTPNTKHEFEKACKKLHDCTRIAYQPIRSSLIDVPIGTLELLARSPALSPFR